MVLSSSTFWDKIKSTDQPQKPKSAPGPKQPKKVAISAKIASAYGSKKATSEQTPSDPKQVKSKGEAATAKQPAHFKTMVAQSGVGVRAAKVRDQVLGHIKDPKIIVIVSVLAIYVLASLFFSSHYLPGTSINGIDVSWRSSKKTLAGAQDTQGEYTLSMHGDGVKLSVDGSDIDLSFDADTYSQAVKSYLPSWGWPIRLFSSRDYEVTDGVAYNERELESRVYAAVDVANENTYMPKNASIAYDASSKSFEPTKEEAGTHVSKKATAKIAKQAVCTLTTDVELGKEALVKPKLMADDSHMDAAIKQANSTAKLSIDLTINGKKVKTVTSDQIRSWITLDEDYDVTGDTDLIAEWTRGELSDEVDTVGTARTFTRTSDGKRIEVYGGGTYGWNMDGATLAETISERIAANSSDPIEIPMISKAEVFVHGKQDWGPRYVDVDLTEQYVRFFDKDSNIIMESECVSGDTSTNDETPTGVFYLEDKETDKKLIGLDNDGDGEPDYESDVDYWMPFYGGYGLHDALWRDYFGADVYTVSGSHGCVNLPYYSAQSLYDLIEVGDVVVVHY